MKLRIAKKIRLGKIPTRRVMRKRSFGEILVKVFKAALKIKREGHVTDIGHNPPSVIRNGG